MTAGVGDGKETCCALGRGVFIRILPTCQRTMHDGTYALPNSYSFVLCAEPGKLYVSPCLVTLYLKFYHRKGP
mgnify:CR=1 FL=1